MQGFSAGTHNAFPMLLSQLAGHQMPEANERQFGLLFICTGWFHPNHPERTACEKPRRRLLFNTAIGGPRKFGFPKRFRSLVYSRAFLDRIHSTIRTVKPVEQSCRLAENPKFRNCTSIWIDRCVGLRAASRLSRKRWHQTVGTLFPITLNPPGRKRSPRGDMCL